MEFWLKVFGCLIPLIVIGVVILDKEMGEIVRLRAFNSKHQKGE